MNALDRLLTAAPDRACAACRHAHATDRDGLYCQRIAERPYPCQVERASSTVEAWLYGACGRDGRFFEPAADAIARATSRMTPAPAAGRAVTADANCP